MFDFHCLRLKSSFSSWSGSCIVPINKDVRVVDKAAGYLPQHLASLRCFLPAPPSSRPNVSPHVFSGGFSGRAEKEEGSLPPTAVRRLTGLLMPPPPQNHSLHFMHLCDFPSFTLYALDKSRFRLQQVDSKYATVALLTLPSPSGWLKGQHVGISNILLVVRQPTTTTTPLLLLVSFHGDGRN